MNHTRQQRITLNMSGIDIVAALAGPNPGAMDVCVRLIKYAPLICPSWGFGGLQPLLQLDAEGIYGPNIWVLYKDLCEGSLPRLWALLCASQSGLWRGTPLQEMSADRARSEEWMTAQRNAIKLVTKEIPSVIPDFNLEFDERSMVQA